VSKWLTPDQILAANKGELPGTIRSLNRLAQKRGWRKQETKAKKAPGRGGGWLYHISLLPDPIQVRLTVAAQGAAQSEQPVNATSRDDLWLNYERLSNVQKTRCEARLNTLQEVERLVKCGMGETSAARQVARNNKIALASLFNWKSKLTGVERSDWLAALAPVSKPVAGRDDCHPQAYDSLKADFLRPEQPTFSACYRRMMAAAEKNGWQPIPCLRTMRRHFNQDIPRDVQKLAREGYDRAKTLYPAQKRTRSHFHAMQAVNMDGHKFDVFVKWHDGRIIRPMMVSIQDLYSNKMVAWRLSDSEDKETVRLCIGDMVEQHGIPDKIYIDNGRAFASKDISGGSKTRYRYKIRDEDPEGLLTSLGCDPRFTLPFSGQSKPIERGYRDLADTISRHPVCAGAWTGNTIDAKPENYQSTAVDIEIFRQLVDQGIAEYNSRTGRNTEVAGGRSFDQAFEDSLAKPETIVRWASSSQRALWLLAADRVRAQRGNGEIHFFGNRYWSSDLTGYAGKKITVRFDPDALADGIKVYDLDDRFICEAQCIENTGFDDVREARIHNRKRKAYFRSLKEAQKLASEMSVEELARMHSDQTRTQPKQPKPPTKVTRLATTTNVAVKPDEDEWDEQDEAGFSRALRLVSENEI